ncbi:hypothetical protein E1263_34550 [Kribbella antibiotica]|uniref:Uncharacterized protein n=1 Tax=Kribbella antibiotica TaxID=190195 RepID=A0A4R4YTB4_9ACTN|nr:hypothetical protein [Kribbella antibiotica]TDD47489.1 hypothetical protein E1263_34550 [Kribbella antibiotica]
MRAVLTAVALLLTSIVAAGCGVNPAKPAAAELRTTAPPWDAPRDAVSYIDKAGFERLPLNFSGPAPYNLRLKVLIDGVPVTIPAEIGVDKVRAEQAPVHTHTTGGLIFVEAKTVEEKPTLAQFFTVWGVKYDEKCLADACRNLKITVDGQPAPWDVPFSGGAKITVSVER